jgi:hypothetical protein
MDGPLLKQLTDKCVACRAEPPRLPARVESSRRRRKLSAG